MSTVEQSPASLLNALRGECWLVHVQVHYPRLNFQVRGAEVTVDGHSVGKNTTKPRWRLMPEKWKKEFAAINNQKEKIINAYSVPCRMSDTRVNGQLMEKANQGYIRGIYVVPNASFEQFCRELEALDESLQRIVSQICDNLDTFRAQIRESMESPAAAEQAMKLLPTAKGLRAATGISYTPFPLGDAMDDVESTNLSEVRRRAISRMDGLVEGIIESAVAEPRAELAKAINDFLELIARDGRVTNRSAAPILRAIEKLRGFSFAATPELASQLSDLELQLRGSNLGEHSSATIEGSGLAGAMRTIRDTAVNEANTTDTISRFRRKLSFD